jgi:TRAP-type C4-dicarboxylate transport system permease small subunit
MIRFLKNIDKWIARFETVLLVVILSIMVILAFLQVVLRNLFSEGILWGDTFLRHLVLWVGFLGASLATREKKHINIDLFTRFFKGKTKSFLFAITNLFAAIICWYLTSAAWTFVMDEKLANSTLFSNIPAWYFQIIIPAGFLLMSFRFFVIFIEQLVTIFTSNSGEVT